MQHTLPLSLTQFLKARQVASSKDDKLNLGPDIYIPPADTRGVTVVMICYHTGPILFESIARVLEEPSVHQLVLIDNGSSPKTAETLRDLEETYERILLVQGHGNIGFARAANMGAQLAKQPWLVFLNPDATLREDAVKNLIEAAHSSIRPCIVGARVLNPDLSEQRGARRGEVTPATTVMSLLKLSKILPFLNKFEIHNEAQCLPDEPLSVATISGACFAMSRAEFLQVGGFDTRFFLHVEDIDLCWRVRQKGGIVLFHPKAEVIHKGQTSHVQPMFVELNKGMGLIYYFKKRADNIWRKLYVLALSPVILLVSFIRALQRKPIKPNEDDF
jgi:N-acetylglucosaminyl-diphospho-decaprenol L-rhamnosyltransferase